jgi:hypothetical protein
MKKIIIILSILALFSGSGIYAQERQLQISPRALDIGVYDYSKVKKNSYKIYYGYDYDDEAGVKFTEMLMQNERLKNSRLFGEYMKREDSDSAVFIMENWAIEYCPELNYVIMTGGHGYLSVFNLETLERIISNPSTYVYSPSGKYRFGTLQDDGLNCFLEIKEGDKYVPYRILSNNMHGVYWVDDETIHYLRERERYDGSKYWVGYSTKF